MAGKRSLDWAERQKAAGLTMVSAWIPAKASMELDRLASSSKLSKGMIVRIAIENFVGNARRVQILGQRKADMRKQKLLEQRAAIDKQLKDLED